MILDPSIPHGVTVFAALVGMDAAIDLYRKPSGRTEEVHDIRAKGMLTPEAQAILLFATQGGPEGNL